MKQMRTAQLRTSYEYAYTGRIYVYAYIDRLCAIAYDASMDQVARTPKQIGAALRRYRRQAELSQTEVGERVSMRQATVSKIEAGEPGTQLRVLTDLLSAMELELVIRP